MITDENSDSSQPSIGPSDHGTEVTDPASEPHFGITTIGIFLKDLNPTFFLFYFIFEWNFFINV